MSEEVKPGIVVVGVGGCGCNTLNRLYEVGVEVPTIAVHTEAVHLKTVKATATILVGRTTTEGRGSGGNPIKGQMAMSEDVDAVISAMGSPNVVIATGGLGGGTASGGIPVLLDEVKSRFPEALRISLVTIPFTFEGINRMENARIGLRAIIDRSDLTIVNMNDLLLKKIGDIQVQYAFKFMDSILVNTLKGLVDLITKPAVVSISFADFHSLVKDMNLGMVGHGVGRKVREALENAVKNKLVDAELETAEGALLYITAPPAVTLQEASEAARTLTEQYHIGRVFWGLRTEEGTERPTVMLAASNVTSPTITNLIGTTEKMF